jgi:ketosteroid isomerase-like protein
MSQANAEVVRQPIAMRTQTRRRLEERLALRFPPALALVARAVLRLPPRSRLRQASVRRAAQLGFESMNRDDVEAALALYHPEVELIVPPEFVGLGLDPLYRGREERFRFQRRWNAEWGEFRYEPEEIIDLGDRLLMVGRIKGSGLSSRAAFGNEWGLLVTISAGRVIREQVFLDHAEALEAAGLSE